MTDDFIGQTLGQYRIEAPLGSGGMGQVFRGMHVYLDRPAAIKVMQANLAANPDFRSRFLQEAKAAAALRHPNIVEIFEFGEQDGILYLVMELMMDGSLRTLLRRRVGGQPWPLSLGLDLVRQAAEGLAAAHAKGMVHRDIKPDNLLLNRLSPAGQEPGRYQLKISDFGLARMAAGSGLTATGVPMGTLAYMSPEQCQAGKLDGRSDLYSLGVVLYEVATGYLPFQIDNFTDAFNKHVNVAPPPPHQVRPDLPPSIEEIILRCLAKKPDERYATGTELASALQRVLGDGGLETVAPLGLPSGQSSSPVVMTDLTAGQSALFTQSKQPTHLLPSSSQSSPPSQAYPQIPKTEPALPVADQGRSAVGLRSTRGRRRWLVLALILLVLLLIFGSIAFAMSGGFVSLANRFHGGGPTSNRPLAASSATVTITPASRDLKNLYTIPAVTGTPDASQHQVQARQLSNTTSPQSQTANATGSKQNPAVQASGTLVVTCRASDSPITIPAGTVFTGNDGVQVVTNVTTTASGCSTTIPAHAVQAGTGGNIQADAMMQPYSGYNINNVAAFTGGQDAQTYTIVQQSDINGAENALITAYTPDPQQALQSQIHSNEQLVSSPQCEPNVISDHAAGDKATTVTVSVTFTCTGEVYDQQGALASAAQWLKQDAAKNPGPGYALVGKVITMQTKAQVSDASQGTIAVSVNAEGVWVYQFSSAQERVLAKLIVGKKKKEILFLLSQQGVAKVDVKFSGGDGNTFPSDSKQIKFVVLSVAGK